MNTEESKPSTTEPSAGTAGVGTSGASKPSVGELFASLPTQLKALLSSEVALAKAEAKQKYGPLGGAIGLFAGAGLFGLIGLCWLIFSGYQGLAVAFEPWLAALITTGALFLITGILGLLGKVLMDTSKRKRISIGTNLKSDVEAIKEGAKR